MERGVAGVLLQDAQGLRVLSVHPAHGPFAMDVLQPEIGIVPVGWLRMDSGHERERPHQCREWKTHEPSPRTHNPAASTDVLNGAGAARQSSLPWPAGPGRVGMLVIPTVVDRDLSKQARLGSPSAAIPTTQAGRRNLWQLRPDPPLLQGGGKPPLDRLY